MSATPRPRRPASMTERLANTPPATMLDEFKDRSDLHRLFDELQAVIIRVTTRPVPQDSRFAIRGTQANVWSIPYVWQAHVEDNDGTMHELICAITLRHSPVSRHVDTRHYRFSLVIQLLEARPVAVDDLIRGGYCGPDGVLLAYDSVQDREKAGEELTLFDFPVLPWLDRLWDDLCPLLPSPIEVQLALQNITPSEVMALLTAEPAAPAEASRRAAPRAGRAAPDGSATSARLDDLITKRDAAQQAIAQTEQTVIAAYRQYLTDTQDVTRFTSHPESQFTEALAWARGESSVAGGAAGDFAYPREAWQRDKPRIAAELDRLIALATQRLATYQHDLMELRVHILVLQRVCEQMGHADVDRVADAAQPMQEEVVVCRRCGARFTPAADTAQNVHGASEEAADEEDSGRTVQVPTPPRASRHTQDWIG
ncbi:MAG TPA: hypothetical protein VMV29_15770 [Ktedonobacterales bacterium]|nr:hypothetical protein [Ktedonobacterales bacterium]